jgi:hypothetical protein
LYNYCNETTTTEWKYSHGSQAFQSQARALITSLSGPQSGLLISYKRFNSRGEKLGLKVALDPLKMSVDSTNYILKGFIVQIGATLSSGHYVSYCLSSEGQWTLFDDQTLSSQTEDEVKSAVQDAYILFFEPEDSFGVAPATVRLNEMWQDPSLDSESVSMDEWENDLDLTQHQGQGDSDPSDQEGSQAPQPRKRSRSVSEQDQELSLNKRARRVESDDSKSEQADSEEKGAICLDDFQDLSSKKKSYAVSTQDPELPASKKVCQHNKSIE